MIRIVNRGLDGKFIYPSGRDLKGCSDGFMLVLAPYADYSPETAATRITRSQCLDMNDFAADIANVTLKCAEQNKNNNIDIAVLTLPKQGATEICKTLVNCDISGIWNFAHVDLDVPDRINVENVHLSDSLMKLSFKIHENEN